MLGTWTRNKRSFQGVPFDGEQVSHHIRESCFFFRIRVISEVDELVSWLWLLSGAIVKSWVCLVLDKGFDFLILNFISFL